MAEKLQLPTWLKWWLLISAPIMVWDAIGSLLRPWTLEGGSLYFFWQPYKLYNTIDLVYSEERWRTGDRFCEAQSLCNLFEVILQLSAVYCVHKGMAPRGMLYALIAQAFTFWKTVLYWTYDIFGGWAHTGHNPLAKLIPLYIVPNAFWILLPGAAVIQLTAQLMSVLDPSSPPRRTSPRKRPAAEKQA